MFLLVHLVGDHVLGGGRACGKVCVRVALCDFCEFGGGVSGVRSERSREVGGRRWDGTFVAFFGGTGECALGGLADLVEGIPVKWIQ